MSEAPLQRTPLRNPQQFSVVWQHFNLFLVCHSVVGSTPKNDPPQIFVFGCPSRTTRLGCRYKCTYCGLKITILTDEMNMGPTRARTNAGEGLRNSRTATGCEISSAQGLSKSLLGLRTRATHKGYARGLHTRATHKVLFF